MEQQIDHPSVSVPEQKGGVTLQRHTPGPWDFDAGDLSVYQMETMEPITGALCEMETPPPALLANVQLMATAPDLLAALTQLLREVDEMTARAGWAGNGGRDLARAALARAEQTS